MKTLCLRFASFALCLVVAFAAFLSVGCGSPSRSTLQKLDNATRVVISEIDVNASLPDQLLALKVITPEQLETVRGFIQKARAGAVQADQYLTQALTAEKPSVKSLAPIVADIIAQLRGLNTLVKHDLVVRFFGAVEVGLRVLGSYFALQVSNIRDQFRDSPSGVPTDAAICKGLGLRYDRVKFELLTGSYEGQRFEEYARALP